MHGREDAQDQDQAALRYRQRLAVHRPNPQDLDVKFAQTSIQMDWIAGSRIGHLRNQRLGQNSEG